MKTSMKVLLAFFVVISIASPLRAQNIAASSLRWNITREFDVQTGAFTDELQKIITNGSSLQWQDGAGAVKYTFQITQTEGTWTHVQNPGAIAYAVQAGAKRGRVELWLKEGRRVIRITVFTQTPDEPPLVVELMVDNIQTL